MIRLRELAAGQPRGGTLMTDRMRHVQPDAPCPTKRGTETVIAAFVCGNIVQSATENVAGSKLACDSVSCKGAERPSSQATDRGRAPPVGLEAKNWLPGPLPPRDLGNQSGDARSI